MNSPLSAFVNGRKVAKAGWNNTNPPVIKNRQGLPVAETADPAVKKGGTVKRSLFAPSVSLTTADMGGKTFLLCQKTFNDFSVK
ncbi:hypothetical protein SAMN05192532_10388 [Alteribacillus iranensis]|uniref:Uncharacterized protein n=1 Tax=Alteribacillus iranensis TaxID=930128 RepID=A0A1I2CMJ8_9BACI|nr:hypothetical protein SAMN05192532_10388 [Alteribacillus iranensis]